MSEDAASTRSIELARWRMVREQVEGRGIHSRRVLDALNRVPRERFVATGRPSEAYADRALPIPCNQTISQPYIVALMTDALELTGSEKVLEVGTGSGYQTAVLAELAAQVISIELHAHLSQQAARHLTELGYRNVELVVGDGSRGWPAAAPYDRIMVTAAAETVPPAFLEQLVDGGILVVPEGGPHSQTLFKIRKLGQRTIVEELTPCRFVPLVGSEADEGT